MNKKKKKVKMFNSILKIRNIIDKRKKKPDRFDGVMKFTG